MSMEVDVNTERRAWILSIVVTVFIAFSVIMGISGISRLSSYPNPLRTDSFEVAYSPSEYHGMRGSDRVLSFEKEFNALDTEEVIEVTFEGVVHDIVVYRDLTVGADYRLVGTLTPMEEVFRVEYNLYFLS